MYGKTLLSGMSCWWIGAVTMAINEGYLAYQAIPNSPDQHKAITQMIINLVLALGTTAAILNAKKQKAFRIPTPQPTTSYLTGIKNFIKRKPHQFGCGAFWWTGAASMIAFDSYQLAHTQETDTLQLYIGLCCSIIFCLGTTLVMSTGVAGNRIEQMPATVQRCFQGTYSKFRYYVKSKPLEALASLGWTLSATAGVTNTVFQAIHNTENYPLDEIFTAFMYTCFLIGTIIGFSGNVKHNNIKEADEIGLLNPSNNETLEHISTAHSSL